MCLSYIKVIGTPEIYRMTVSITLGRDSKNYLSIPVCFLRLGTHERGCSTASPNKTRSVVGCLRIPKSQNYPNTESWSSPVSCAVGVSSTMVEQIASLDDAIEFLFPPEILVIPYTAALGAFLSPLNRFVDELNDIMIDRLEGEERVYYGLDEIKEDEENNQCDALLEYFSFLGSPGIPDHALRSESWYNPQPVPESVGAERTGEECTGYCAQITCHDGRSRIVG
ncbi:hypothetical protein BZA77DRAFT_77510 [Pyronema omphalodes]|nr:hypothetical protein BZA77DRAFT_77510 [Pyronema omphalodes]